MIRTMSTIYWSRVFSVNCTCTWEMLFRQSSPPASLLVVWTAAVSWRTSVVCAPLQDSVIHTIRAIIDVRSSYQGIYYSTVASLNQDRVRLTFGNWH